MKVNPSDSGGFFGCRHKERTPFGCPLSDEVSRPSDPHNHDTLSGSDCQECLLTLCDVDHILPVTKLICASVAPHETREQGTHHSLASVGLGTGEMAARR